MKHSFSSYRTQMATSKLYERQFGDFKCIYCHNHVSAQSILGDGYIGGVHNRNHCPYCLWSKHVDLFQAGDRLAACKASMQPIGLTAKKTHKKYGPAQGELMLIHLCVECGKISINRIAADDDIERVFETFKRSIELDTHIRNQLANNGITALQTGDIRIVQAQLLGQN